MIRDPRDRYASVTTRWNFRLGGVGAGTAMWLSSVHLALENQKRYPDQYLPVRYETLATYPEKTMQEICDFLGEPYIPEMLTMKGAKTFRKQGSNSSYGNLGEGKISTSSIGRFRQVLSPMQIAFIQKNTREEMPLFAYDPEEIVFSFQDQLLFSLADFPFNQLRLLLWRLRYTILNFTGRSLPEYRVVRKPSS